MDVVMNKQTKDLILLNMLGDIGHIRLSALLSEFKNTEAIFNAPLQRLKAIKGIGLSIAEKIKSARADFDVDKEVSLAQKQNVNIVTIFDKAYPETLKSIYNPPILLYVKGDLKILNTLSVAIVGSRRCSQYGLRTAQRIAKELSAHNIAIISGMARGIDTAAHNGAIKSKGKTVAVLGNGLSSIYPPENKRLADEIADNGAIVSEFCMEMPPHKGNFPRRNRVISGLSEGVVVVEAAFKSGALITADFALSEGKEVFAVPGPAGYPTSCGTNNLIKEGAKLAESADDILQELIVFTEADKKALPSANLIAQFNNANEKDIYGILSDEPQTIDDISEGLSFKAKDVRIALLQLEVRGIIKELPGKLYVKA